MRSKERIEILGIFVHTTMKTEYVLPIEIVREIFDWIMGADNQIEVLVAAIEAEMDQMEREEQEALHA